MPYITSVERIAIIKSLLPRIQVALEKKFGEAGLQLFSEISNVGDFRVLEAILDACWTVNSLEELRRIYQPKSVFDRVKNDR